MTCRWEAEQTSSIRDEIRKASHLQYTRDVIIDQENSLVRKLQFLQCEVRKTHHMNSLAVAQYNGWLANLTYLSVLNFKPLTNLFKSFNVCLNV